MITLHIENRAGEVRDITVEPQGTLMEAIRDNGFEDLLASCGGCCSCATCHVVIDPSFYPQLGAPSSDEDDLLDSSDHRQDSSRLSCQVPLNAAMDGLSLRIAEAD